MGNYPYLEFTHHELEHLQEKLISLAELSSGLPYIAYENRNNDIELITISSESTTIERIKSIARSFLSGEKTPDSALLLATLQDFNNEAKALLILDTQDTQNDSAIFDVFRSHFEELIKKVITRIEPIESVTVTELLNNFTDHWWIKNSNSQYLLHNNSNIKNLQKHNYDVDYLGKYKGKTDFDIFPTEMATFFNSMDLSVLNAKTQLFFDGIEKTDEPINAETFEQISAPIIREDKAIGLVSYTRDTSMYCIKDDLDQLKVHTFSQTLDFILIIDNKDTVIDCNPALLKRLNYNIGEVKGGYYKKFIHQNSHNDIQSFLNSLIKEGSVTGQLFLQTKREEIVPIKFKAFVKKDTHDNPVYFVMCAQELFDSALRPENFEHKKLLDQYTLLEEKCLRINDKLRKTTQQKKEYQSLFEASTNGLWYVHMPKDNEVTRETPLYFSQKFISMLGYASEEEFPSIINSWITHIHLEDYEYTLKTFLGIVYTTEYGDYKEITFRMKRKSGDFHWYNCTINVERDPRGQTVMCSGQIIDVDTQMIEHMAMEGMYPIAVTDNNSRITKVNKAFLYEFGYTEAEIIGQDPALFQAKVYPDKFYQNIQDNLTHKGFWRGEVLCQHKDGTEIPTLLNIQAVTSPDGKLFHNIGTYANISQQKAMETKLKHLSEVDSMTGCFNRSVYESELAKQTQLMINRADHIASLAIIDLDYFKKINDRYGHQAGDVVIIHFAKHLKALARKTDLVARIGGEEFAVIMPDADIQAASTLLMRLHKYLNEHKLPLGNNNKKMLRVTASFGITDMIKGDNMDDVYKRADHALYVAKKAGRNSIYTDDGTCIISSPID